jgi:hypothetical protein
MSFRSNVSGIITYDKCTSYNTSNVFDDIDRRGMGSLTLLEAADLRSNDKMSMTNNVAQKPEVIHIYTNSM